MIDTLKSIHRRLRDAEKSGTLYPTLDVKQAERQGKIARQTSRELNEILQCIEAEPERERRLHLHCVQGWLYLMIAPRTKEVFDKWDARVGAAFKELEETKG